MLWSSYFRVVEIGITAGKISCRLPTYSYSAHSKYQGQHVLLQLVTLSWSP
jgi:hypothetical protein